MHDVVAAAGSAAEENLHSADDWETSRTSDFKADPNSSCELATTVSFTNSTRHKAASICTTSAIDVRFISGPIPNSSFLIFRLLPRFLLLKSSFFLLIFHRFLLFNSYFILSSLSAIFRTPTAEIGMAIG